jgi:hypothetical protein
MAKIPPLKRDEMRELREQGLSQAGAGRRSARLLLRDES